MKRATITLTDDLEQALELYRQEFETPPGLDAIVQRALMMYLKTFAPERQIDDSFNDTGDIILPTGPKPEALKDAPSLIGGGTVSDAVIEDRR